MKLDVKWPILNIKVLFLLTIIFLSALSFYSFRKLQGLIALTESINYNNTKKLELERQISLLKDAETGQRGFLLTRDSSFLEPYFFAFKNVDFSLKRLDSLTKNYPEQNNNTKTLSHLIHIRLSYIENVIVKSAFTQLTKADFLEGKKLMDKVRKHATNLIEEEDKVLEKQKRDLLKASRITPVVNIVLVCFSLAVLLFAYSKILKDLKRSQRLQSGLIQSEARLKATLEELEQNKASEIKYQAAKRFELIANTMPQFIWTSDLNGSFNYFSQSFYDTTGTTLQLLQHEKGWHQVLHPNDISETERTWTEAINTSLPLIIEHRFKMKDGKYRWQLSRAVPQKDDEGNIQMWVGTSTDIEDQKMFAQELDLTVQRRTAELKKANNSLEKSNGELAQFAYIASHDLQEPLRKIQSFISRLVDTEASLSEKAKDYFLRIKNASKKMQQLITDILSYSRNNDPDDEFVLTDLNKVFEQSKEQLIELIEQKKATINTSVLPTVSIIPFQFEQLFTNLLSNALKFAKQDVLPVINVSTTIVNGHFIQQPGVNPSIHYYCISFSDNGIGFEPSFNERIFGVFQRLHSQEDYIGTGIGLAIVRKIIDNHHGSITASGQLNNGATFTIYLPA